MGNEEKNLGGRPLKFETPEEMQKVIDDYFARCIEKEEFPTISGLAFALDITTQSLRLYEKRDKFFSTINKGKQRVEMAWEQRLLYPGAGPAFWLKNNAGWKDKQELEHTGKNGGPIEYIDLSDFSDEELEVIKQAGIKIAESQGEDE